MKLRFVLLVAFLALDVGLVAAFVFRPSLVPDGLREYLPEGFTRRSNESASPAPKSQISRRPKLPKSAAGELWSSLHSSDLSTFVQRLRAAGFPPAMVRSIVDAEVE